MNRRAAGGPCAFTRKGSIDVRRRFGQANAERWFLGFQTSHQLIVMRSSAPAHEHQAMRNTVVPGVTTAVAVASPSLRVRNACTPNPQHGNSDVTDEGHRAKQCTLRSRSREIEAQARGVALTAGQILLPTQSGSQIARGLLLPWIAGAESQPPLGHPGNVL